jgi:hypothetical protein
MMIASCLWWEHDEVCRLICIEVDICLGGYAAAAVDVAV